jgi:hypothetical protein
MNTQIYLDNELPLMEAATVRERAAHDYRAPQH